MSERRRPIAKKSPSAYHHGHLREALIAAALRLIGSGEDVNLREAARLVGVSPGAPFRHFRDKAALLAAVAEETMRRFRREVGGALDAAPATPAARIHAMAMAYLRFALGESAYFRAFARAGELGFFDSDFYKKENQETLDSLDRLILEGQQRGEVASGDLRIVHLASRAFVYGLGRMYVEGHFARMGLGEEDPLAVAQQALSVFEQGLLRASPSRPRGPSSRAPRDTSP
ncbi:TetR/AcrR family transcriptional regulator [Corallococcus macrosporus]|uniref:TetR/AcrR family transcriptional regulator n=1 Tax=Corallococcus macrosporus TaxID=35 RepID=A0ABS3DPD5_9BACT|nr:TetR/AcrR family transcriptional regulator [Corallococcus macrosporus]MBN8233194.1 TetR/AcrR family transcriptional regulator [Corallococcus macrosporus]